MPKKFSKSSPVGFHVDFLLLSLFFPLFIIKESCFCFGTFHSRSYSVSVSCVELSTASWIQFQQSLMYEAADRRAETDSFVWSCLWALLAHMRAKTSSHYSNEQPGQFWKGMAVYVGEALASSAHCIVMWLN